MSVFNSITLDGYFTGPGGDLSWAHTGSEDTEWNSFVAENAGGGGMLLFGRVTYDMMIQYWPTPAAKKNSPAVAERMNAMPKVVFSRTLDKASWSNTRLLKGDLAEEVRKLKKEAGEDIAILGSGTIIAQLAQESLIDTYQFVVVPIVLGKGRTMFEGVKQPLKLKLTRTRSFANGKVVLWYEPMK